MMKEERRISLDTIPHDHSFSVDGREELCHATGDAVRFEPNGPWWNEYVDRNGDLHYGR